MRRLCYICCRPVIVKVQRTATLLLPGWDGAQVTQDYDITFSEVTQVGHADTG